MSSLFRQVMLQHQRRYQNGNNLKKKQMKSTNHLMQTVGLLVGANCAKELVPNKIMLRQVGGLHEFRAILIWWIVRPVGCWIKKLAKHNFATEEFFKGTGLERIPKNMH